MENQEENNEDFRKNKMKNVVKYDENCNQLEVTDADMEDIEYWDSITKEAVDAALKELYAQNISSVHGDEKGIYEISPEGKKTYVSE